MSQNIINDGYTRRARIAPQDRLHCGLEFSFRPMLPEQVEVLDAAVGKSSARDGVNLIAKAVASHLESWSEVDESGKAVAITFENVRRLPYPLLTGCHRIVACMQAGDPIEGETSQDEQDEYLATLLEGDQSEADRKN